MPPKPHVVIVEDDTEIARLTAMLLESEGYSTSQVHHGNKASDHIREACPDAVVLDIMLPGKDGIEVCAEIRNFYTGPVLMLTGCDEDISEISAFKQGADDYVTKPIRPHILLARIDALMRRCGGQNETQHLDPVRVGELSIYIKRREVLVGDNLVELTSSEFDLLSVLAKKIGSTVSRDDCCTALRGVPYDGLDRSIDMRISTLRKKLGDDVPPHQLIKTVRSKGYLLVQRSEDDA